MDLPGAGEGPSAAPNGPLWPRLVATILKQFFYGWSGSVSDPADQPWGVKTMLNNVRVWLREITELGLLLVALAVVLQILFGTAVPFIGADVVGNITDLVGKLGNGRPGGSDRDWDHPVPVPAPTDRGHLSLCPASALRRGGGAQAPRRTDPTGRGSGSQHAALETPGRPRAPTSTEPAPTAARGRETPSGEPGCRSTPCRTVPGREGTWTGSSTPCRKRAISARSVTRSARRL